MYIPKHFYEDNWPRIRQVIEESSFAIVVSCNVGTPTATHVPLRLVESADGVVRLQGHRSKANRHWRLFADEARSLAIFAGPDSYVSPRWYDHLNVPTWNYIAVHLYGKVRVVTNGEETRELMKGLVDRYEGGTIGDHKYTLESLPADFLESQMRGIVVFEILVDEIQANFKLSQNRDAKNYDNVIKESSKSDDQKAQGVAQVMASRRSPKP